MHPITHLVDIKLKNIQYIIRYNTRHVGITNYSCLQIPLHFFPFSFALHLSLFLAFAPHDVGKFFENINAQRTSE